MSQIISKLEELVTRGALLVPQGGFDFSGYNVRLQNKYLEWRKACLEALEQAGPIGFTYKNKILGDANGGFFYQTSAQLIYVNVKELFEKVKASPELAAEVAAAPAPVAEQAPPPAAQPAAPTEGRRILRPPPKAGAPAAAAPAPVPAPAPAHAPAPPAAPAPAAVEVPKKVFVIGEINDPLRQQLALFLEEIKIEEIPIDRTHGEMVPVDHVKEDSSAKFAFFVLNADDLGYVMFEIGHFVGKLGRNHVCVLHSSDVSAPKNIPGVIVRAIDVKLEEASFSLMRDLKAAGYVISF
ncbi:MAG: TIR domain-containing protein [bacterium]